jgi:predicted esterase
MTAIADIHQELRHGSWCPGGPETFRVDYASSGEVGRMSGLLLDIIWPLNEWLDGLIGDEAQVRSFAATWHRNSEEISSLRADIESAGQLVEDFEGTSFEAMRARVDEIVIMLEEGQQVSESVAVALDQAITIVVHLHDAVVGAIAELVRMVGELARPWNWDLNPFDGNEMIDRIVGHAHRFAEHIGILLDGMFDAFDNLLSMLGSLHPWIQALVDGARRLVSSLAVGAGTIGGAVAGGALGGLLLGPLGVLPGGMLGSVLGGVLGGGASDLLAPAPEVTRLDPEDAADEDAVDKSQLTRIESVEQLVRQNGYTDGLGGNNASAVDIKAVQTPNGVTYVVSLPSTKDWGLLKGAWDQEALPQTFHDRGATNDLDSNVDLMVAPFANTQYERAVMQAMVDAGVPPGADVVYTGFSQGGIMAANLASDANSPYHCVGVITNGSPIDTFDIPADVPVLAFQHERDIVPGLDGNLPLHEAHPGQHTVTLPAPVDHNGQPLMGHDSDQYADSVAAYIEKNPGIDDGFDFLRGDVIDHQQFTWAE